MGHAAVQHHGLDITVDRDAEIPIGVQLAWALRSRIGDGRLQPGQRLPGLRDVAEATGVNVNTVRAVYQRLEQEGLVDSQQGSGTFVASTPRQPSSVATIAADAAREAQATGVDPREVAAALYVSRAASAPSSAPDAEIASARRRALREQIATLERTLGELEAKHPGIASGCETTRGNAGPALLDTRELEGVRAHLLRRLADVQAAIDALGSVKPAPPSSKRKQAARSPGATGEAQARPAVAARGGPPRRRASVRPAAEGA